MNTENNYKCTSCDSTESQMFENNWKQYIPVSISLLMLLVGITMDNFIPDIFNGYLRLGLYIIAYIPVAFPVFREAV